MRWFRGGRAGGPTALVAGLFLAVGPGFAQENLPKPPPTPVVNLQYLDLTNRAELKLKLAGQGEFVRPVGDMHFAFPPGEFPAAGLDPRMRTFCIEPLVPVYAGEIYPFQVDPLNTPQSFGLADNEAGRKLADRKTMMIRELYGRYYQESLTDSAIAAPAFQTAVWEIFHEQDVPEGPMPLNLFTGTFQANYPNEAAAPVFVQRAQKYVQSLTGDDTVFLENANFAGIEPVRLTAVRTAAGTVAQSQLALRTGPGGGPGIGGGGPLVGAGGSVAPIGGGFAAPGASAPFFPGLGGGTSSSVAPTASAPGQAPTETPVSGESPATTSPQSPQVDTGPGAEGPSEGEQPSQTKPSFPETPPEEIPPIPAPPAVLLGGLGIAIMLAARRIRRGRPQAG